MQQYYHFACGRRSLRLGCFGFWWVICDEVWVHESDLAPKFPGPSFKITGRILQLCIVEADMVAGRPVSESNSMHFNCISLLTLHKSLPCWGLRQLFKGWQGQSGLPGLGQSQGCVSTTVASTFHSFRIDTGNLFAWSSPHPFSRGRETSPRASDQLSVEVPLPGTYMHLLHLPTSIPPEIKEMIVWLSLFFPSSRSATCWDASELLATWETRPWGCV